MKKIISRLLYFIGSYCPNIIRINKTAEKDLEREGYFFMPIKFSLIPLLQDELDLSIVIPVYNSEKYIRECLDSLINQKTCYRYEIICVNDGSTDSTIDILNEYGNKYGSFLHVINKKNEGIAVSRNKGIEIARGKYIGFIDNDDYVSYNYIEIIMKFAHETNADIIQAGIIDVDDKGCPISMMKKEKVIINYTDSVQVKSQVSGYVWNGVIRKTLFEKIRFPDFYWYEDMITRFLLLRIARKTAIIDECLYFKRAHKNNASRVLWKSNNIKSIDSFWLAKCLVNYGSKELDFPIDDYIYNEILYEFGTTLCVRTRNNGIKIHRDVFSLASKFVRDLEYNFRCDNSYTNMINKSLLEGNYLSWIFLCLSNKIRSYQ